MLWQHSVRKTQKQKSVVYFYAILPNAQRVVGVQSVENSQALLVNGKEISWELYYLFTNI